jgi:hypothetical protein
VTDPTPTGYGETGDEDAEVPSGADEPTLTTDDEAQRDDLPGVRPGNEAS